MTTAIYDERFKCAYDKLVDIDMLQPNPKNPNKHPDRQIEMLAKIIKYQGQRAPIVVSNRSGFITKGHGRLMALKKLEFDKVAVDYQDYEDEAQEYADMIADNKIAELAEHDDKFMTDIILAEFPDIDLELLGLDDFKLEMPFEQKSDEDAVPADVPARAKLGDIYQLGNHRLMCGDSTDKVSVDLLMNGVKADMVFTDPPYELLTKGGGLLKESKAMREIAELGIDKFNPESLSLHADTNIFCCNKPLIKKYIELAEKNKVSWDLAVYHKQNITPNYGGHLMTDLEYLLVIGKQSPRTGINEDKSLYSKLYSGGKDQDNDTAWSKPVALCEKFIKLYSTKSVMDYFGGSGSTLIACEKTNRKCFMMELDPHYVDVIIKRWEDYTGQKAELISSLDKTKPIRDTLIQSEI